MDEQTATQLAAAQLVDQLGKAAGFMIALRLVQVIAERSSPVTPELVEAYAGCLKTMEHFAQVAGLQDEVRHQPSDSDGASAHPKSPASDSARDGLSNGHGGDLNTAQNGVNGSGGGRFGGNGTRLA